MSDPHRPRDPGRHQDPRREPPKHRVEIPRHRQRPIAENAQQHGRPISWIFVSAVLLVFTCGGLALILNNWVMFWVCAALLVAALPIGHAIRITDDVIAFPENDHNTHNRLD
ncbi:hypothetical protein [Acrocarpospora catenulata]|uniref:hypothetical protein n=1 Tax=Acrocarpospora catenulata TaxID=2836182 RepID=UPI001BDAEA3A|nr:hypothetical protein [Acrocarpospora catenulata]